MSHLLDMPAKELLKFQYALFVFRIGIHQVFYRLAGVYYCSMVESPKVFADVFQRALGELLGQVHGYLPCLYHFAFTGFYQQLVVGQAEIVANHFLYIFYSQLACGKVHQPVYRPL